VVENLLIICEALGSIPSGRKNKMKSGVGDSCL
jgi:hypothetical protein